VGAPFTRSSNLFQHLGKSASTFSERKFDEAQYRCGGVLQFSWNAGEVSVEGGESVRVLTRHQLPPMTTALPDVSAVNEGGGRVDVLPSFPRLRGGDHEKPNEAITDMIRRKRLHQ
jgi:hypothetical protein